MASFHAWLDYDDQPEGEAVPEGNAIKNAPNIVLILADDIGWNDIASSGLGLGFGTPNLD